jgi:glutamine synthetase
VPPVDSAADLRSGDVRRDGVHGHQVEVHHHEVATAGQNEIGVRFNTLVKKADEVQIYKYCVLNVADAYGKTATFMPKPLVGDNGNGMHVHQSISKGGKNLFYGDKYAGLSEMALYYIGGIIKHAKALNAFTNGSTNSYKRLVPGFEAPVLLAYSARNRSASIRCPYIQGGNPRAYRIEVRFPDSTGNPYLIVRRHADGRARRHQEQDPPRRRVRQGPLRPASGGAGRRADRGALAGRRPSMPWMPTASS